MIRILQRSRLGYPVLPDNFTTAAGVPESFSPQTPDSLVIHILGNQNQQLPPDLAAKWGAQSSGAAGSAAQPPAPAVTPSGQPISTQTAAPVRLLNLSTIAPGVFRCSMSDGTSHYCDPAGNPISYAPPPAQPAVTPAAASLPTAAVSPSVQPIPPSTPQPGAAPAAVTAGGQIISSTSGAPQPGAPAPSADFNLSSIFAWLQGSMFGGLPNWLLVGGAALLLFADSESPRRRR